MSERLYIYIKDWDRFQHYGNRRPIWIKNYLDLLENDAYLDLPARDRALLEGIWKWAGVVGNGRVPAHGRSLRNRLRLRYVQLDLLVEAGFLDLRASKALAPRYQLASAEEEGSKEPKKREERAREAHAASGAARTQTDNGQNPHYGDQKLAAELARINREEMGGPA